MHKSSQRSKKVQMRHYLGRPHTKTSSNLHQSCKRCTKLELSICSILARSLIASANMRASMNKLKLQNWYKLPTRFSFATTPTYTTTKSLSPLADKTQPYPKKKKNIKKNASKLPSNIKQKETHPKPTYLSPKPT